MLQGIVRESTGKKASKARRQDGYLIANIYSKGLDNIHTAFKVNDFLKTVKQKETFAFEIKVGEKTLKVVIQEYQKDPVSYNLVHVDLIQVQPKVVTFYQLPIHISGIPKGLKNKGVLMNYRKRLRVKAAIEDLPDSIDLDVSDLDVGDNILVKDIQLNDKVKIYANLTVPVVGVIKAK